MIRKQWPLTELQQKIYDLLREAAMRGMVCPSSHTIARAVHHKDHPQTIDGCIQSLVRKDLIEVEKFGGVRVVTICETGEMTRLPADHGPRMFGDGVRISLAPTGCFYCGARDNAKPEFKCRRCR